MLDIVLQSSPSASSGVTSFPVAVLYEGRPLVGAQVKLTDLDHDAESVETERIDGRGQASFRMPGQGSWLLNVVWTKLVNGDGSFDFDTVFSSLSFGVPK